MKLATIAALLCTVLMFGLTTSTASAGHYGDDDDYDEYDYGLPVCGCCHLYCGFGYRSASDDALDDDDNGREEDDRDEGDREEGDRDEDDRDEDDRDDDYVGS